VVTESHDWLLVAPWYRWPRQAAELKRAPRQTRPVLQKYEDSKLVDAFIADPQHSLKWNDDDWVYEVAALAARTVGGSGPLKDKISDQAVKHGKRYERYLSTKTPVRKLFLDSHRRFYLVVCELHCDVAGFPAAKIGEVCQQGFVIRRRYTSYPKAAEPEAAAILENLSALQLRLAKLEGSPAAKRATRRWEALVPQPENGARQTQVRDLRLEIARRRKDLRRWAAENGVMPAQLGWVESDRRNVGSWQVTEDEPQTLLEGGYPLYPLHPPDPNDPEHSGQGSSIYFGVVPTGSIDHDPAGNPRYDDRRLYEIRCFVRRHKPTCPRTLQPNDCNGELFWSRSTEVFRLAAPFDPVGTAHRPINITLPDFPALAAAAASRPPGALSPVAMAQPDRSSINISNSDPVEGSVGGGQVCFLAIPLLTIVAWFVINIFLPVLMLVMGLWFLLRLKLCIPPSVQVQAGLDTTLDAELGQIDVDLGAAAAVGFDLDLGDSTHDPKTIHTHLTTGLTDALGAKADTFDPFSNKPLAEIERSIAKPQRGPDFSVGIEWEEPVLRAEAEVLVA
jgi:hypothetical protein